MKKTILFFALVSSIFLFSQEKEFYKSHRTYSYPKYEDEYLLKLKTENYIQQLKIGGYKIEKNEITQSKIDIDVIQDLSKGNKYKFTLLYLFNKSSYTVGVFAPKIYFSEDKEWVYLDPNVESNKKLIDIIENVAYKIYQNEMNSNF